MSCFSVFVLVSRSGALVPETLRCRTSVSRINLLCRTLQTEKLSQAMQSGEAVRMEASGLGFPQAGNLLAGAGVCRVGKKYGARLRNVSLR